MKKSEFKKNLGRKIALALGVGMFSIMPLVQALPAGGQSGSATIKVSGSTMDISGAANNVINWQSFSIGKNETVSFDANNYLNLVNGPDVSNIYGTLKGGGNIFLVNPNGIVFGSGAVINVGSLTASTAPINSVDTAAFLNGNTTSITGSVTEGSDISMALVNVEAANSLVLNAGEVVLQNTDVLDKVSSVTGATEVIIGADGALDLTLGQISKLPVDADRATLVKDFKDLSRITNMNGKYLLAGDVDLSSASFTSLGAAGEETGGMQTAFTGYFNGLGYTVNELSGSNGLFAQIGKYDFDTSGYSGGTVKNLRLENVDITSASSNGTGALAGSFIDGTVSNIYVSGKIVGTANEWGMESSYHGGIVGSMGGDMGGFSATMRNVENTATVTGGTDACDIGGVVGMLYGGTITNAKNSGAVDGTYNIGGIVGQTGSAEVTNIKYAYNTGEVNAGGTTGEYPMPGTAGGIIGAVMAPFSGDSVPAFKVDNAYNSGKVAGDSIGGIIGEVRSEGELTITPNVTNSYYVNASDNTYGTSVSAAELQAKVDAIWGGAAASDSGKPSTDPTTDPPTTPADSQSGSSSGGETAAPDSGKPSTEPTTPTTPTTPTADSQSGSSSRMDVIRDILTELMGSNMSSEQRRSMERDTENNIVAATSNPGRGDRPMAAMPTADTGAAAPAGDSSIVENTDKSASTGGEVNSNDNEDEN